MQTLICSRLARRCACQLCSIALGPPYATHGATPRHQCMGMHVPRLALVTPVQAPYILSYAGPNARESKCLNIIADESSYPVTKHEKQLCTRGAIR